MAPEINNKAISTRKITRFLLGGGFGFVRMDDTGPGMHKKTHGREGTDLFQYGSTEVSPSPENLFVFSHLLFP